MTFDKISFPIYFILAFLAGNFFQQFEWIFKLQISAKTKELNAWEFIYDKIFFPIYFILLYFSLWWICLGDASLKKTRKCGENSQLGLTPYPLYSFSYKSPCTNMNCNVIRMHISLRLLTKTVMHWGAIKYFGNMFPKFWIPFP